MRLTFEIMLLWSLLRRHFAVSSQAAAAVHVTDVMKSSEQSKPVAAAVELKREVPPNPGNILAPRSDPLATLMKPTKPTVPFFGQSTPASSGSSSGLFAPKPASTARRGLLGVTGSSAPAT